MKQMQKQKLFLTTIFSIVAMLAILPGVMAITTIDSPVTYSNHTTTLNISVSVDMNDMDNMTNVTCYYNLSGGAATTFLVEITNSTPKDLVFENSAVSITSLTDATTYNISCQVRNLTTLNTTVSNASIMLDSTSPLCSINGDHNNIPWKGIIEITWTSSDAIERVSTAVDIDGPQDQTTVSYTDANKVLDLLSQDTKYVGDWTTNMTVTDRAGNTCTASYTFKSYLPSIDGVAPVTPAEPRDKKGILLLLGIVGVVAYFIFKKK